MLMDTSGKRGHSSYQPPRRADYGGRMRMQTSGKRGFSFYQPPRRGNISQRFNPYNPEEKVNPVKIDVANENEDQGASNDVNNISNNISNNNTPVQLTPTNVTRTHLIFDDSESEEGSISQ
eukprot:TRINITY_DN8952_c0_g1_i1.p1 TRINITY_DN8952_c0_g1~~TRINITY_DN8952_c0_g1_i1.p1  ORF type:complete len:121 (+),score=0.15 TRINITY_DN8952_c0_g1_i1:153-515(+)